MTSCKTKYGIPGLIEYLEDTTKEAPWRRNANAKVNGNEIDIINEMVKSAIYRRYYYNIPFQTIFDVTEFAIKSDGTIKATVQINC